MDIKSPAYRPQKNPIEELKVWMERAKASDELEPTAMALATLDKYQNPRVRIVLCKKIDSKGIYFFTNYESNKAIELENKPYASVVFHWKSLDLQVRCEGAVQKVSRQESEDYFNTRPRESQIGAWTSSQSRVLNAREDLEKKFKEYEEKFLDKPVVCPPFWGGYCLHPGYMEFWAGQSGRLHNRIQYIYDSKEGWSQSLLYP